MAFTTKLERAFAVLFDSTAELLSQDELEHTPENTSLLADLRARCSTPSEFRGGLNEEGVRQLLITGWPEGLAIVESLASELRGSIRPPVNFRRRQQWRDEGDEPSWEREQQAREDFWRTSRRQSQRGPAVIELASPWGGLGDLTASQLMWNGVVISVLADLLEAAGYRVGATLTNVSIHDRGAIAVSAVVKRPEEPLDLASLVPLTCHAGVFRTFVFYAKTLAHFATNWNMGFTRGLDAFPEQSAIPSGVHLKLCYSEFAARNEISRVLAMVDSGALAIK